MAASVELYSKNFVSYNVHCLQHITDITWYYLTLDNCSAYRFENYMSQIKCMIRGTGDPLIEVANTLFEHNAAGAPAIQTHVPRPFKKRDCV